MVRNFLKDGKEVKSISGYVVKVDDAQSIYRIIDRINERKRKENDDEHHI